MIRFQGRLTPDSFHRALRRRRRPLRIYAWIFIIVAIICLPMAHLTDPFTWGMPLFLGLFGALILNGNRATVKRAFATDRTLADPVSGEADEQGVRMESTHGGVDMPWTLMHKVVVTPDLVTLYQSASIVRIVPREFFADDESWQAFLRLVPVSATPAADRTPRMLRTFLLWMAIVVAVALLWFLFNGTR
ncbi:MAG TPA: YcxB family protein [Thermoanaerobaculia bacterium]|nr:YcxB family protein [Thermoanaerobaculia bacterium]